MLKVHWLWADRAVSCISPQVQEQDPPLPELAGHSPAQAVSSRGRGGSAVKGKRNLLCEAVCLRRQLLPASSVRRRPPCGPALQLERERADGLAGPDSSQIAWEVWVECRGCQEQDMEGRGAGATSCHLLGVLPTGEQGCPSRPPLCGLQPAFMRAAWREAASVWEDGLKACG